MKNIAPIIVIMFLAWLAYDTIYTPSMEVRPTSKIVKVTKEENQHHVPVAVWVVVVVSIFGGATVFYQSKSRRAATNALYNAIKEEPGKVQSATLVKDEFGTDPVIRKNDKTFTMGDTSNLHNIDPDSTEEYRNLK